MALVNMVTKSVTKSLEKTLANQAKQKVNFSPTPPNSQQQKNRKRERSAEVCENCGKQGHNKSICWADGGGAVGSRPDWWNSRSKKQKANKLPNTAYAFQFNSNLLKHWR
jgi:ribosomal protein L34E